MQKLMVIWNRGSGKAEEFAHLADSLNDGANCFLEMTRDTDLAQHIRSAVESGVTTVVAAGGDGTVNAVVNALMMLDDAVRPALAILPMGTANDFAATLCLPDALPLAIELLGSAPCVPIDIIRIRADGYERFYANVAAGGNSVRVSEKLTDEMKSRWGAFCYLRGGLDVLADLHSFRIRAECDGEVFDHFDSWTVLVANGRMNGGRIVVAPRAVPNDGLMDVILIRGDSVIDIAGIIANALAGDYLQSNQVVHRQVRHLKLRSEPGMRFTLDGEVVDAEPVEFDVIPGAIRMLVGPSFQDQRVMDEGVMALN